MKKILYAFILILFTVMSVNPVYADRQFIGEGIFSKIRIPSAASPTVAKSGEIAVDSDGDAAVTDGFMRIYIDDQAMWIFATDAAVALDSKAMVFNLASNKIMWEYVARNESVASPEYVLYDSGATGTARSDERAATFGANITTVTEDDVIADVWISVMSNDAAAADQSNAEVKIFEWDGSDYSLTLGDPVGTQVAEDLKFDFSTGTANEIDITSNTGVTRLDFGSITLISTGIVTGAIGITTDADAHVITDEEAYGYLIVETGDDQTVTLPSAVLGMNVCVMADGADASATVIVELDGSDHIEYDGTTMANGEYITNSSSEKGDYMCFAAIDTDTWVIVGYRGTLEEETPP